MILRRSIILLLFLLPTLLFAQQDTILVMSVNYNSADEYNKYYNSIISNIIKNLKKCESDEFLFGQNNVFELSRAEEIQIIEKEISKTINRLDRTYDLNYSEKQDSLNRREIQNLLKSRFILKVHYLSFKDLIFKLQFFLYENISPSSRMPSIKESVYQTLLTIDMQKEDDTSIKEKIKCQLEQVFIQAHCAPKVKIKDIDKVMPNESYYYSTNDSIIIEPQLYESPCSDINKVTYKWPILPEKFNSHNNKIQKGIIDVPGSYTFGVIANDGIFDSDISYVKIEVIDPPEILSISKKLYILCYTKLYFAEDEPKYFKHDPIYVSLNAASNKIDFRYSLPDEQLDYLKINKSSGCKNINKSIKDIFHIKEIRKSNSEYEIIVGNPSDQKSLGTYDFQIEALDNGITSNTRKIKIRHYKLLPISFFYKHDTYGLSNKNEFTLYKDNRASLSNYSLGVSFHWQKIIGFETSLVYTRSYSTKYLLNFEILNNQFNIKTTCFINFFPNNSKFDAGVFSSAYALRGKHNIYHYYHQDLFWDYGIYYRIRLPNPSFLSYVSYSYMPKSVYSITANIISGGIYYNLIKRKSKH